jgi:hypothetical protein
VTLNVTGTASQAVVTLQGPAGTSPITCTDSTLEAGVFACNLVVPLNSTVGRYSITSVVLTYGTPPQQRPFTTAELQLLGETTVTVTS